MRIPLTNAQTVLLSLCGLLLAALIYELTAPLALLEPPQIRLHSRYAVVAPPEPFLAPSPASFTVINDRPVFSPLRQPIRQAALPGETASATVPPVQVKLIGVIVDGQNKLALIKSPGAAFASGVAVGGNIAGWQVSQITPDGIVLHSGSSDYTIKLNGGENVSTPAGGGQPQQKDNGGDGPAPATDGQPQQEQQE